MTEAYQSLVLTAPMLWALAGPVCTVIVHLFALRLRDHTWPPGRAYPASLILGPIALSAIFYLRRDGRGEFLWRGRP